MHDFLVWLILTGWSLASGLADYPLVVFVPEWVVAKVGRPQADCGYYLRGKGRFSDIMGGQSKAEDHQDSVAQGRPGIIEVCVDLDASSVAEIEATVRLLRKGWNPKVRTIFIFRLFPSERRLINKQENPPMPATTNDDVLRAGAECEGNKWNMQQFLSQRSNSGQTNDQLVSQRR
jgi:hypothetical protein